MTWSTWARTTDWPRKRSNQQDYTVRMKEFFDHYLQGKRRRSG